ncbi:hypothetical protein Asulf_01778 [Archaeoglobus sulfaticallidus PM70-1]|uniref:Uncharacterized protein n=2 Tax=Archaeoglobus TaxID=2233 RepID=N0BDN8_9EURY|nr:hypothetical protein Asulf_01778 [Archaeoglobus sulfaticallidus PM70-1]
MRWLISFNLPAYITLKIPSALILVLQIMAIRKGSQIWARRTAFVVVLLSLFPPLFNTANLLLL